MLFDDASWAAGSGDLSEIQFVDDGEKDEKEEEEEEEEEP